MMFFSDKPTEIYAKVWNITRKDKYTDLRISTSEKKTGEDKKVEYSNSNWFVRCIGHAHNKASELSERDNIKITKLKFTNELYENQEGQKRNQLRVIIFEFEIMNNEQQSSSQQKKKSAPKKAPATSNEDEEEMPF